MTLLDLVELPGVTEEMILDGPLGFLAFHGGLEGGTETVARAAAEASHASLYTVVQPPSVRWHLPSHLVGGAPTPALEAFLDHVALGVAVHGYGRPDRRRDILVGGANRLLAAAAGEALRRHLPEWNIVSEITEVPAEMRGLHRTNPVNLCRDGGVQLELPPGVRGASGRWVDPNLDCRPEPGLIDALVEVARHFGH